MEIFVLGIEVGPQLHHSLFYLFEDAPSEWIPHIVPGCFTTRIQPVTWALVYAESRGLGTRLDSFLMTQSTIWISDQKIAPPQSLYNWF
jgi:hypothetical protein